MSYLLTPETDPTAFVEPKDGLTYHLCDLPMHHHHVAFPHGDCNEAYWANSSIWEYSYR